MMHYRKGENIESEMKREDLPFDDCLPKGQEDFLWMQVKGGTKVSNVLSFAKNALDNGEYRTIVWTGAGGGVVKTVSCAEILKRTHPMYQVTRMCYKNIEEHWLPQLEGLDEIVVNRQIPCLHILMSLEEIEDHMGEVQKPNTITDFINPEKHPGMPQSTFKGGNTRGHRGGRAGDQQRNQNQPRGDGDHRPVKKQYRPQGSQKTKSNQHQNRNQDQNREETPKSQTQSDEVVQSGGGGGNPNRRRFHRKPKPSSSNTNSEVSTKQPKSPATPRNHTRPERTEM